MGTGKSKFLKVFILIAGFMFVFNGLSLLAQDEQGSKENSKKGWNFGLLPTITYNTDQGFQYGGLVNFYHYGDGSRYPKYDHSLYFELSRYTKGSGINRFFYDSDRLIKGLRTTVDLSYLTEKALDFWGFNGYNSVYKPQWETQGEEGYISRMFYKHERQMFRFKVDLQGKLGENDNWLWLGGFGVYRFWINDVNIQDINEGKSGEDLIDVDATSLFSNYKDWGVISQEEAKGGWVNYLKAGIVYDSRDARAFPAKGIWSEAVIRWAPGFLGQENFDHSRFTMAFRYYVTLAKDRLVFANRFLVQHTLWGEVPFYMKPNIATSYLANTTSQGLGGFNSLRGILRHRVVGDGIAFSNFELRWKIYQFRFINQNFYIGTNLFFDTGLVTQEVKLNLEGVPELERDDYFKENAEKLHNSVGLGLKIAMNENFIVSADFGKALNKQDGNSGFYVGLNYLF